MKTYLSFILFLLASLIQLITGNYLLAAAFLLLAIDEWILKQTKADHLKLQEVVRKVITPGDLADRLAIANIKEIQLGQWEQAENTRKLMSYLYPNFWSNSEACVLFTELFMINREQWEFEDRVRTEKSIEACLGARECNNRRVAKKNEINKLFEAEIEMKSYKGEV